MIVGVAMSSAAPLISKTMKNSQVGNFQIMRLNRDLDSIRKDITNIKNNYVTKLALTETLKKYVTNDALAKILESYVTNDNLTSKLADYAKTSDLPDLTNYATNKDIANFLTANDLSGYITSNDIQNLSQRISNLEKAIPPIGSIIYVDGDSCPDGWQTLNNKFTGYEGNMFIRDLLKSGRTAGNIQDNALPNITGTVSGGDSPVGTGAFELGTYDGGDSGDGGNDLIVLFNAHNSNPIYQDGVNEVRPKNIALLACRRFK
ncbi:hypothetical protein IJE86_03020 [bacterium]|nr:hypothetical protein [bacterium]